MRLMLEIYVIMDIGVVLRVEVRGVPMIKTVQEAKKMILFRLWNYAIVNTTESPRP